MRNNRKLSGASLWPAMTRGRCGSGCAISRSATRLSAAPATAPARRCCVGSSRLRGLARKPLVLLRDDGRNEKAAVESLSQEDACYLIRQATLEDMLRELRAPAHSPAESLEKRCERIYRSWGLNTSDANKRYLTGAVRVMMASDHRLAIRKEILGAVAQEHHLTIAAVDSALRRLLDTLDATGTQAWLDFRKEYGLERKRVTIGRLIYALESKLSQQEG